MLMGWFFSAILAAAPPHPELGTVEWERDFATAKAESARRGKPLLVLFDEVPGCSTVRGYGERVLRHPLIKEAMESLFVPVVVFNNVGGDDRRVLNHFDEPTWNNPVLRIMSSTEEPLAPRLYGDYSVSATARTMVAALEQAGRTAPSYLELLAKRKDPTVFLSPGQMEIYAAVRRQNGSGWKSQIGQRDFVRAYGFAQALARTVLARR